MEHITQRFTWHYVPFTDVQLPLGGINVSTVVNTLLVVTFLLILLRFSLRRMSRTPGRAQALIELLVEMWDSVAADTLDTGEAENHDQENKIRRLVPLLSAMFLFILTCNAIAALPLPFIQEPTTDPNCTFALGIFSLAYATYCGFVYRGIRGSLREMAGPMWEMEGASFVGAAAGKATGLLFFPLHITSILARVMSLSFRLFGNIMGGAVIMAVVFLLTRGLVFPLLVNSFFIMFEAAVQAFVFTMLTLVYTAVAIQ